MAPPAPALQYKPTADCAYTQLVSRIKGSVEKHDETAPSTQKQEQEMSDNYNQYYESQYYQFYHQIAQQYATQGNYYNQLMTLVDTYTKHKTNTKR